MNAAARLRRKIKSGDSFVVRACDRHGHTHAGAVALARRRIARGQGHSHTLLVVQVTAVVRLRKVTAISVEEVNASPSKRSKPMVR